MMKKEGSENTKTSAQILKIAATSVMIIAFCAGSLHLAATQSYFTDKETDFASFTWEVKAPATFSATSSGDSSISGENPGAPGENPGTPGEDPGTPGENPGTPGEDPGTPGENPGTPGGDPGTPGGDPGTPGGDPGTPSGDPGTPGGGDIGGGSEGE